MSDGAPDTDAMGTDPPLAVDIDGTLTNRQRAIHPEAVATLQSWDGPVVVATGKALPYPVALCEFLGVERTVIAENGGVAFVHETDDLQFLGDREGAQAVVDEYRRLGYDLGWGRHDLVNRWRETEVAVNRDSPLEPLERLADDHGLQVVDTGYAYHVKSPDVSKGRALESVAAALDYDRRDFVAIGDSVNDVSTFEAVGDSFAVANADDHAREAADTVTEAPFGEGFLEAIEAIRSRK
jgi:phosphoglycolate phosphatase (TIGR01487 family)